MQLRSVEVTVSSRFTLRCHSDDARAGDHAAPLDGVVCVLGQPRVGERLVMVGEAGVLQTSTVHALDLIHDTVVIRTRNSRYTLVPSEIGASHAARPHS